MNWIAKIIEKKKQEKEILITFINLKAALDSVDRNNLWNFMKGLDISRNRLEVTKIT